MSLKNKPQVAVIGGGIFGLTAALELSSGCEVDLYEREAAILTAASFANHNRHHFGFHYPRSPETALQCLEGRDDFDSLYGESLVWDFPNYYFVGTEDSKVTGDEYIKFCRSIGLEFKEVVAPDKWVDPKKVQLSLRVKEAICDFQKLNQLALNYLNKSSVRVHLGAEVVEGTREGDTKVLQVRQSGSVREKKYDIIVSAIYANHNRFCDWFGFPKRHFQFNVQELDLIQIDSNDRVGLTVMDGPYPSILPFGRTPYHIMAHVNASQLVREDSFQSTPLLSRLPNLRSNWEQILETCSEYYPFLKNSRYCKSIFVDRVVDSTQKFTDSRVTELEAHGSGCYSIFAAKIITCVTTAKKLHDLIQKDLA
jgi:hypothetical protein